MLFTNLTFKLARDDGAVVWLNGRELYRSNMPTNAINYLTLASVSTPDEQTFFPTSLPATLLVPGTNVVAVEVHQAAADSSDLGFNLELTAYGYIPGTTQARLAGLPVSGSGLKLTWPANAYGYRLYTTLQPLGATNAWSPVSVVPTTTNGQSSVTLPTTGTLQLFRLGTP